MTIQEEIDADLKDAMRARDAERLSVLRLVKSAMMNASIEKRSGPAALRRRSSRRYQETA